MRFSKLTSVIILAVLALHLAGCETLQSSGILDAVPKPSIESIVPRITGIDLQGVKLAFDVGVNNPYSVPIKSPRFDYQLAVAEQTLFDKSEVSNISLPAKGLGKVTLPVQMNYQNIWRSMQQFKDAKEIPYTLKGNLLFSPMGKQIALPLEKSGKVPVLRPPTFSSINVVPPEVAGGAAKVGVEMAVQNPNVFSLGLEQLKYGLRFGEVEVGSVQASTPKALEAGESGRIKLNGLVSGMDVVGKILAGSKLGAPALQLSGAIQTPYGPVNLR